MPTRLGPLWLAFVVLAVACTAPSPVASNGRDGQGEASAAPKRITVAIMGDPPTLSNAINSGGGAGVPGATPVAALINAGLTVKDDRGGLQPRLSEAVPTVENGLWKVFPDGQMETTWRMRPGIEWHDGVVFSPDDLLFSARLAQDKGLAVFSDIAYESIASVEAPDARTLLVRWKRPYVDAAALFDASAIMPQHVLERPYGEDRANFINVPYWSQEFIGTGPFKLRQWEHGSYLILEANPRFVLGRPRLDEIEVKTIPDPNTLAANILAGSVDLTLDRNLDLAQEKQVSEQWGQGRMVVQPRSWLVIYPQVLTPDPPVVGDVRFRRALLQAIDRQEMADTLLVPGVSQVAHNYIGPKEPEYDAVQPYVVRYDYDPRRAAQSLEEMGYRKGSDGTYRDAAGEALSLEVRSRGIEIGQRATLAAADSWQRLGLKAEPVLVPPQRGQDREYMSNFPGFLLYNQPADGSFLKRLHSTQTPLPENSFVGQNNSRYMDPRFDALIDGVFNTIPWPDRMQVLGQAVHLLTDQLLLMGLFYNVIPGIVANKVENVSDVPETGWKAEEWDVRS